MKKKTLAALFIAAASITFVSCDWFKSKDKKTEPSIVGKWQVDSLYPTGKDTNSLVYFLYALSKKDSTPTLVQFNADSTFIEVGGKDSLPQKYYVQESKLFIQEDSAYQPYQFAFVGDSTLNLLSKDSAMLVLKRK